MFILSADPSLGRVDYSSLSDQTLMEMLTEGFDDETKKDYQDNEGMYLDVCKWSCIKCDDDERVSQIDIDSCHVIGSLDLCYIPPKVNVLNINSWRKSKLTGSVDLRHLPGGMQKLDLQNNQLTGEIDLTQLPDRMGGLGLNCNQLTGEVDLTRLPDGMGSLSLSSNEFIGKIDLTQLPEGMEYLYLSGNHFSGSLVIKKLPPRMKVIYAQANQFNAIAVVDLEPHTVLKLKGSGVTSVVDENGRKLDGRRFVE